MKDLFPSSHNFVSSQFDDIYFSKEDGIEETKYVFLKGNQIPARWTISDSSVFNIGELGFGTGLNFFVTKEEWDHSPHPPNVFFYSLEKYPLSETILKEMETTFPELKSWENKILNAYSDFISKFTASDNEPNYFEWSYDHPKSDAKFYLKLYLGDVLDSIKYFKAPIDCFYLDGFAPKKNPEMWSAEVMNYLHNLSEVETTFATFTSAGFVKRNLEAAGFSVVKQAGFGRKREMLVGKFDASKSV